MDRVLILNHNDVVAALPPAQCARVMAEILLAHARGETFVPPRSAMAPPAAPGIMGLMPAWRFAAPISSDERTCTTAFGVKAVCVVPDNAARGLDPHQGTMILFDPETGAPTAILEASALTAIRTAAITAVATQTLARENSRVLSILGVGFQGRAHLKSLASVGQFDELRIFAPTRAHAIEAANTLTEGPPVRVMTSAEEAVRGADVVVTATSSRNPVLRREWLAPGAHINAVGASLASARELDTRTVADSAYFCDSRGLVCNEAGEFAVALAEGAISGEDHIRAEIGEVLAGTHPGRTSDSELTVFRSLGLAIADLAAAQAAVTAARERGGMGTVVAL
jgi:ornithine cyclodeaminase/alanine dehydrogenase-like protein (mu-crystallin family)